MEILKYLLFRGGDKMVQENPMVKMHNNLAEARYQLSPVEQKIFIYAIRQIDQNKKEFNEVDLVISELAEIADISEENLLTTKKLSRYIKNIMRTVIEAWGIDEKGREQWTLYNLTQTAKHVKGEGIIRFKFNEDMMPLLLDLQKNYFIQAPEVITFTSTHSMRMYDFFKAKAFEMDEWNTTIDEFKKQFGLENQYKEWTNLRRRVLDPATKEINTSDIQISYEMRKRGRSAYYLDFRFETIEQQVRDAFNLGSTKFKHVVDEIRERLKDAVVEFTDGQIYEFYCLAEIHEPIHDDAMKFMSRTIDYMNSRTKPIRNRYSYLKKSLEEGYVYGQMTLDI